MEEILTIQTISKHFEGIKAVDNVSFSLTQGTITGIYGDNGAGKTTLFNLISGFEVPDSGIILLNGKNITHKSVLQRAQMGMGRLFQNPRVFSEVTVLDNLLAASSHSTGHNLLNYFLKNRLIREEDAANKSKSTKILEQFSLCSKSNHKAYELSVGERKLLSLGCLLMNDSSFILLDELTSGLNSKMIERMNDVINQLNKSGVTFLMIEHDDEVIKKLCTKTYKMQNGKLIDK
jgi:ABC-type branched-subunit amino acid transport system ATPase component